MAFVLGSRSIKRVGIVGSGQIGPDIALHMTKVLTPEAVAVVVVDIAPKALDAGRAKLAKKIDRGVEDGAFTPEQGASMKANVTFTEDYGSLQDADFVIEAATENLEVKRRIFSQLENLAARDAILASNSSHLEPESIFEELRDPSRASVVHYFFPAERNPLVEIVPGEETREEVAAWLLDFYEAIGKVPIRVESRYGYAIDPIFEGLFQAAALAVEEGLGTTREVDEVAREALGLGVGPFTAMNLTGGNPITAHGLDEMSQRVNPWFRTPEIMKKAMAMGTPWDVPAREETVEVAPERAAAIRDRMMGAYFGLANEVLSSGIVSLSDLELGCELGLVIRPPFAFMNQVGVPAALEKVRSYQRQYPSFPVSEALLSRAASGEPWEIPYVIRRDFEDVAVLVIRRPQVLNALNLEVFRQISRHLDALRADESVRGVVITGFGRKAFVAGADVSMLAKISSREEGEDTSWASHEAMIQVEDFEKPVVCAYNGLAFGGGNELGMACHARIARKGLSPLAAQPEPNLGIIPGAGATQRLPRLIGLEKAWPLLRTGGPISGGEAVALGLVREEIEGDLLKAAVDLARAAAHGEIALPRIRREPMELPDALPDVELGHLSLAVDEVMRKVILEGAKLPLAQALQFEAACFGEVCGLEDMKIGVSNFMKNGPRVKAEFVHR